MLRMGFGKIIKLFSFYGIFGALKNFLKSEESFKVNIFHKAHIYPGIYFV